MDIRLNFQSVMVKKSDKELEEYLINIMAYNREIVEAAINEFKNRGRIFTEDELSTFEIKIEERENTVGKNTITVRNSWEKEIVDDKSAISLFSRKTINWSTLIFGVIVGSILMTSNLIKTKKIGGIIGLLLFTIIYLIIQINILLFIESKYPDFLYLTRIGFNGVGALFFHTLIWNILIGKNIKYRTKPVWLPIILGICIEVFVLLLILRS